MNPRVSVHCASYNHERFVEDMVHSVLNQSMRELELVVVDDGSQDGTVSRLKELEATDKRLRLLQHQGGANRGWQASLRLAVDSSSGPYLARIDSDDRWLPDKLELQLPALEAGALLSYGRAQQIDQEGRPTAENGGPGVMGTAPSEVERVGCTPFEGLLMANYIPALTVAMSRSAYERAGGYSESLVWEDYGLWLRLVALRRPAFVDGVVAEHRLHPGQGGRAVLALARDLHENVRSIEDLLRWPDLPDDLRSTVRDWLRCHSALIALVDGDIRADQTLMVEDARRLRLLLQFWAPRILELVGARRFWRWRGRILRHGGAFEQEVGPVWKSQLRRRLEESRRRKDHIESARLLLGVSTLVIGDRLRRATRRRTEPAEPQREI